MIFVTSLPGFRPILCMLDAASENFRPHRGNIPKVSRAILGALHRGQPGKGVAMNRIAIGLCAALGLFVLADGAQASWGTLHYGGYQPWWNIFAKRQRCLSVEEERLQRFWHDYYDSLKRYYDSLDNIDWVSYYKNHGYQINTGTCTHNGAGGGPCGGCQRIQFAPVFVSPSMQWAVPNASLNGPPPGHPGPPPGAYTGGPPGLGMGGHPGMGMGGPPYGYGMAGPPMGGYMGGPMAGPMGGPMGGFGPMYGAGN
jgi:hypothetical protein